MNCFMKTPSAFFTFVFPVIGLYPWSGLAVTSVIFGTSGKQDAKGKREGRKAGRGKEEKKGNRKGEGRKGKKLIGQKHLSCSASLRNIQQDHWGVLETKLPMRIVMIPRNWLAFTSVPCLIISWEQSEVSATLMPIMMELRAPLPGLHNDISPCSWKP